MAGRGERLTREELEREIAALEKELREREAALPLHSARPAQLEAIEELEERIAERKRLLEEVSDGPNGAQPER